MPIVPVMPPLEVLDLEPDINLTGSAPKALFPEDDDAPEIGASLDQVKEPDSAKMDFHNDGSDSEDIDIVKMDNKQSV